MHALRATYIFTDCSKEKEEAYIFHIFQEKDHFCSGIYSFEEDKGKFLVRELINELHFWT